MCVKWRSYERLLNKVLPRHSLIRSVFCSFWGIVVLVSFSRRAESKFSRLVVAQLVLHLFHLVDLVGTSIRAWPNRFVILDSEIDSSNGVFSRKNSNLVCGCVLETGCWRIEHNHLIVLLYEPLHLLLEPFFVFQKLLVLHDVKLCIRCQSLNIVAVLWRWQLLASLQITWLRRGTKRQSNFGGSKHTETHSILFSADRAHVRHFCCRQELVPSLHLWTFEHLKIVNRFLHFFSIYCFWTIVHIARVNVWFEPSGTWVECSTFFAICILDTQSA